MSNNKYILSSEKAIAFYNKNPSIDFNFANELFVDLIGKINESVQETITVNEIKSILNSINTKVNTLEQGMTHNNKMIQMTYDQINTQKDHYIEQMKNIITHSNHESNILSLIRETNASLIDKTIYSILQEIPKSNQTITNELKSFIELQQKNIIQDAVKSFEPFVQNREKDLSPEQLEKAIQNNYTTISDKITHMFQGFFNQDSMFYQNNMEMKHFLEKQKNSTLKGKESEEKLEPCLVSAFPHGTIINKSGEAKSCDYLLERQNKASILFENKDYRNNVPNEEIKKFIRDIEYQNHHGIMLSQHSGINNKNDYQIDIHANKIMVFVHFVNYDESKIRIAVNIIDHLDGILKKQEDLNEEVHISMEQLSEINKEYLQFVGQKKQLIESYKKSYRDHLKQLEEFELPQLTDVLNHSFTNVEQTTYKCEICGLYTSKTKRGLTTHQNKCKKNMIVLDQTLEN